MITPCKDCTERQAACHASCDRYKGWKQALNEKNAKIREAKAGERLGLDFHSEQYEKWRRKSIKGR